MNKKHVILGAIVVLLVGITIYQEFKPKAVRQSSKVPENNHIKKQIRPTVDEYSIYEIISDYKNNEIEGDEKYKGKIIKTSGVLSEIKKDSLNRMYVVIGTDKSFSIPKVQAFFDALYKQRLSTLKPGESITVVCRAEGLNVNVIFNSCHISP